VTTSVPISPFAHVAAVVVDQSVGVAVDEAAEAALLHVAGAVGDVHVEHLGRADAVVDLDAGGLLPRAVDAGRQGLAGADQRVQRARSCCAARSTCSTILAIVVGTATNLGDLVAGHQLEVLLRRACARAAARSCRRR
jgi:hypothetical protein